MGDLVQFPFTDTTTPPLRAAVGMASAPRNGTPIWVMVAEPGANGVRPHIRWLPFPLRWFAGEWRYARHNTKLFEWHQDLRGWQRDKPECLG